MLAIVEGDSPDSVDLLCELSQLAAHRGMGTPNERIAAQWLAAKLRALGYEVADRKSTRLNSSHLGISYAVFCLKKKITIYLGQHKSILAIDSDGQRLTSQYL